MDKIVEIWDLFRNGDENAFAVLFETFVEPLYRYGMKFVADENLVKDCIQDLFVKLHDNQASLSPAANPKFYLLLSMKNILLDAIAKNQRMLYIPPDELPFIATYITTGEGNETEEEEQIGEKFEQLLQMLNPRQKEAIYLRYQLDLSYEEIAELLGINYQSARNLIHRAIQKIREQYGIAKILPILWLISFHT